MDCILDLLSSSDTALPLAEPCKKEDVCNAEMSKADTLEKVCSTEKLKLEQREGKEMTKAFWLHRIFRRRGQETKKAEQPNKVRAASVDGEPPEVG